MLYNFLTLFTQLFDESAENENFPPIMYCGCFYGHFKSTLGRRCRGVGTCV